jgi:hypothetical protein
MSFILLEDLQEYISVQGTCVLICGLWLSDEVGGVGRAKPSQALAQEVALRFVAGKRSRGKLIENQWVHFLGFAHRFR